jgi:hypothetical protein
MHILLFIIAYFLIGLVAAILEVRRQIEAEGRVIHWDWVAYGLGLEGLRYIRATLCVIASLIDDFRLYVRRRWQS